ncbi:MAG TPA: SEC-C metal-binding domain-containing protein [Candidatus Acidoferrales bacterium]|jgi:hypothetical protein|nr:SEC-C metal-binding domain-containing protein [Candidatus Acidoferrales bacterium]
MPRSKIGRNDLCSCGSGKKYKKCCLPKLSGTDNEFTFVDAASSYIIDRLRHDSRVADERSTQIISSVFQAMPTDKVLEGAEGATIIVNAMSLLEQALATIAQRHSPIYWTLSLRRLPPLRFGRHRITQFNIQWTAELSCVKYGSEQSVDNEFEDAPSSPGAGPWGESKKKIPRINSEGVIELLTLYRVAAEYYFLTAAFRRIGKGWRYILRYGELKDFEPSPDLEFLIDLYDSRQSALYSPFSTLGVFIPENQLDQSPAGLSPYCLVAGVPKDAEGQPLKIGSHEVRFSPPHEARFAPGIVTLDGFIPYLRLIEKDFEEHFHTSPYTVLSCVGVLSNQWGAIVRADPFSILQLITRGGYLVSEENMRGVLAHGLPVFHKALFDLSLTADETKRCIDAFLELAVVVPREVDLQGMNPKKFCWGSHEWLFVNFAGVLQFLITLALAIPTRDETKQIKGDMFEADIETHLNDIGAKPFVDEAGRTSKKFKANGQLIGEADCCRLIGSVLVIIEAKAYSVPNRYDRGDYSAIRTRMGYLDDWLAQADRLSENLSINPVGNNYDLREHHVSHVLGIICTPYTEFIPSRAPTYFLESSIPRIATPKEIRDFLIRSTPQTLAKNPNSREVA